MRGIDPRTSRMLSERSTIWATSPENEVNETNCDVNLIQKVPVNMDVINLISLYFLLLFNEWL